MLRVTLTLEKDVAARLAHIARKRGQPLREVVHEALRAGLPALDQPPAARPTFHTTGFNLGLSLVGSLDNVADVLARVEGDGHR